MFKIRTFLQHFKKLTYFSVLVLSHQLILYHITFQLQLGNKMSVVSIYAPQKMDTKIPLLPFILPSFFSIYPICLPIFHFIKASSNLIFQFNHFFNYQNLHFHSHAQSAVRLVPSLSCTFNDFS